MTDAEVETLFCAVRWPETSGKPVCPHCECQVVYERRRPSGVLRWRCNACRKDFSLTSGTPFASHKLPLRSYLMAVAIFVNEVKSKSALTLSRDLGVQYKTAFVLARKMREAKATKMRGVNVGGAERTVEIDGAYFGGYVKPANLASERLIVASPATSRASVKLSKRSASATAAPARRPSRAKAPPCPSLRRASTLAPRYRPATRPARIAWKAASHESHQPQ